MEKVYAHAGFWIRLLARLIDFSILAVFSNIFLISSLKKTSTSWEFRYISLFYLWGIFTALLIFIIFVLIPIWTKSGSLGYKICKLKVISNQKSFTKAILDREFIYGISWTIVILLSTIIINHTLIYKLSNRTFDTKSNIKLSVWEQTRVTVVASISSVLFVIQAFSAITIILNKDNLGLHDRISQTFVIRTNKKVLAKNKTYQPIFISKKQVINEPIIWIEKEYNE